MSWKQSARQRLRPRTFGEGRHRCGAPCEVQGARCRKSARGLEDSGLSEDTFVAAGPGARIASAAEAPGAERSAGDALAPLLEEVAAFGDFEGRRAAADHLADGLHHRRPQYRVFHPDRHERPAAPFVLPEVARAPRDRSARRVEAIRDELRKTAHARLEADVLEWRAVGGDLGVAQVRAGSLEEEAAVDVRRSRYVGAPVEETLRQLDVASAERGVHDEQPSEAVGHVDRQREAEQAAPVLADEGDVSEVEAFDKGDQELAVEVEGVGGVFFRLVGSAEAEEVGSDHAVTGRGEDRDHLSVEIAPGGLAVEAEEDFAGRARAYIHVARAEAGVARAIVEVAWGVVEAGQVAETVFGGAEGRHRRSPRVGHGDDLVQCCSKRSRLLLAERTLETALGFFPKRLRLGELRPAGLGQRNQAGLR